METNKTKKCHSLLDRSFTKREQRMVGTGAFITFLLIAVSVCTIFQEWANLPSPMDIIRPSPSPGVVDVAKKNNESINGAIRSSDQQQQPQPVLQHSRKRKEKRKKNRTLISSSKETVITNIENGHVGLEQQNRVLLSDICSKGGISEFCDMKGDIRIDPNIPPTVYYVVTTDQMVDDNASNNTNSSSSLTIKPYARNDNAGVMESVREWTVKMLPKNHQDLPHCSQVHDSPGVIFSLAGYCGNIFHSFSDVLIPLFATARPFNRDVELLITDYRSWFVSKFASILQALSRYNAVDVDNENQDGKIHCFSRLILGLKGRQSKELSINTSESGFTTVDFKKFLRSAYNLNKTTAIKMQDDGDKKSIPMLLIIARSKTRALTNADDVERTAIDLGFNVTITEMDANVSKSAEIMNSCDVVLGVHGAGLTNMVFLPENAVQIQVVPIETDWIAKSAYWDPTEDMKVRYLEYKIRIEESSLSKQYPPDHAVFTDPQSFAKQGWTTWSSIYMNNQNVTLDMNRFTPTLVKALELLHQ